MASDESYTIPDALDRLNVDPQSSSPNAKASQCEPQVVSESKETRLLFQPMYNQNGNTSSLKGYLIYEHRSKEKPWPITKDFGRGSIKKGQRMVFEIHSDELSKLFEVIDSQREIIGEGYENLGYQYVRVDFNKRSLYNLILNSRFKQKEPQLYKTLCLLLNPDSNSEELIELLNLSDDKNKIVILDSIAKSLSGMPLEKMNSFLSELSEDSVKILQTQSNYRRLCELKSHIEDNLDNNDEDFWQKLFTNNHWILSQLFVCPIVFYKDKANVGTGGFDSHGGVCDYLLKNNITDNVTILEIKTPCTQIMNKTSYRDSIDTYAPYSDISGAVVQVMTYKDMLSKSYYVKKVEAKNTFCVFDPPCAIIAGRLSSLTEEGQKKSFELFRNSLHGVQIITFDEVVDRINLIIDVLTKDMIENNEHS